MDRKKKMRDEFKGKDTRKEKSDANAGRKF